MDRCADLPDAPRPEPYRPPPGTYARHGRKKPKNLYLVTPDHPEGWDIGRLDTPEMAALVVEALNLALLGRTYNDAVRAASRAGIDLGDAPYPELMAVYLDAGKLLAGRDAGHPELLHQELLRIRGQVDKGIRAVEDVAEREGESGA